MTHNLFIGAGVNALDRGNIQRGGHVVDYRVKQLLNTLVFEGCTADNGYQTVFQSCLAQCGFDLGNGDLLLGDILLKQALIDLRNLLDKLVAVLLCHFKHIIGNRLGPHILAQIVVIDVGNHVYEVDDSPEVIFFANG